MMNDVIRSSVDLAGALSKNRDRLLCPKPILASRPSPIPHGARTELPVPAFFSALLEAPRSVFDHQRRS